MASLRKRGKVWYYRFTDADGVQHEYRGCTDRRETEGMAAAMESDAAKIRAGIADPKDIRYRTQEARPLPEHLDDFRRSIEAKKGKLKHALVTANRATRVLALAKARR